MQSKRDDKNIAKMGKSPTVSYVICKRDSGYGTDVNSPCSYSSGTSVPRQFTFGSNDTDVDKELSETLEDMNFDENEEVFTEHGFSQNMDECRDNADDVADDDDDKEVEELLIESNEVAHSRSEPINIQRPQAPVPTPDNDDNDDHWELSQLGEDRDISRTCYKTNWTQQDRARRRFKPIARSCGTQTPSPQNRDPTQCGNVQRYGTKERVRPRLRLSSESECRGLEGCSPLPDVVPQIRDRSVSLPDVPSFQLFQEQEVGRELRRISDEFHSSFTPVRRRRESLPQQPSSFPRRVNIDIHACWSRIRRIVSSSSFEQGQDNSSTFDTAEFN